MKLQKRILLIIAAIVTTLGVSNAQVKQNISEEKLADLLGRIDTSTEHFAKSADKAMDKAGYDGSAREDELNTILKNLKSATECLERTITRRKTPKRTSLPWSTMECKSRTS